MPPYLSGLLLGLPLILPIGAQNLFVLTQGLALGLRPALIAGAAAACSDTLLVLAGSLGASAALTAIPALRGAFVLGGTVLLVVLGLSALKPAPTQAAALPASRAGLILLQALAVSLLNPHAILDSVGLIGGAVAARPSGASALRGGQHRRIVGVVRDARSHGHGREQSADPAHTAVDAAGIRSTDAAVRRAPAAAAAVEAAVSWPAAC